MLSRINLAIAAFLLAGPCLAATVKRDEALDEARRAFEASDYQKAIQVLQAAAAKEPTNGDIHLLLAQSYLELQELDAAIHSAEKAAALDPKSSIYHEWLARAYGEKADHEKWPITRISLAKKTGKEFETAVELDGKNFSARQALIEFDCSAPGMVGGGEDKAQPHIKELMQMDAAEGHYGAGNCRRQKKDFATADEEFTKALESQPKSAELIYDIGDYAVKRAQADRLLAVASAGEHAVPSDLRGKYYRGVGLVLKKEELEEAENLLREYAKRAPKRNGYPSPAAAHAWLGRLYVIKNDLANAKEEFENALRLDPKNKMAQEELKKIKKD